ncbi:MAG: hypothetical protein PHT96_06820 [Syntrophorhabdaceae bacterium]|nr:hypothetical protein [Syntrophorhabdaceae bacterium]MDD4196107.1 hypothetical protein [Syntrophorhabdaceae bacterium]HOC45030.1 hypothetical protein [Syntrophorhabdaceae bacterium]
MKRYGIPVSVVVFLAAIIFPFITSSLHAVESGCVQCHTSDKILKSLHAPKKVDLSEGVG